MPAILWVQHRSVVVVFVVFALLLITLYWPGRRRRFEHDANIPLRDDD